MSAREILTAVVVMFCVVVSTPAVAGPRDDTRALQRALNVHRAGAGLQPLIVDGLLGPRTRAALAALGTVRHDGARGALERMGQPAQPTEFRLGARGAAVRALQRLLNENRRAHGLRPLRVDGILGSKTEQALADFHGQGSPSGSVDAVAPPDASAGSARSSAPGGVSSPSGNTSSPSGNTSSPSGNTSSPPGDTSSAPGRNTTPLSLDGGWLSLYGGLTQSGAEIPRAGLSNPTLRRALGPTVEPQGTITTHIAERFVSGRVSWFGGRSDRGVTATETGAITGENLRRLNTPADPSPSAARARPAQYYYVAMRFDYSVRGRSFWRNARLLVINPSNDQAIVVRPVDWGPHTRTRRILDLSPQAMRDLGIRTDGVALVAFAKPGTPLGVVR